MMSCKTIEDRNDILFSKKKLKSSSQYSDVFINPDITLQQRIESENMRILVKSLKSVDPSLSVKVSCVVSEMS